MQVLLFGILAVGIILALWFNVRSRQIAQLYPAQLAEPHATPSAKWRANLKQLYGLSALTPQLYQANRAVLRWQTGFLVTVVAALAILVVATQLTTVALIWPVLTGVSAVGFGWSRIHLFATQLTAWQQLFQQAPEKIQEFTHAQIDMDQLQQRAHALMQVQYVMIAAFLLLAIDLEIAFVTLLPW